MRIGLCQQIATTVGYPKEKEQEVEDKQKSEAPPWNSQY